MVLSYYGRQNAVCCQKKSRWLADALSQDGFRITHYLGSIHGGSNHRASDLRTDRQDNSLWSAGQSLSEYAIRRHQSRHRR